MGLCLLAFGLSAEAGPKVDRHGDPLPDGATARLGTIRQRIAASKLVFSADGRTVIAVAAGRAVSRWDALRGRMRDYRLLPGRPTDQFWLSVDGRLLAVNEDGKSLAVFDTESGARKCLLAASALHAAFSRDGKLLATGEYDKSRGRVRLWDLAGGKDRLLAELPSYVNDLAFRPDGKRLFAAVDNHSLRCWDVDGGKEIWKNDHWASHLAVSPDGRTLCSDTYSGQGTLPMWDAGTGRPLGVSTGRPQFSTSPMTFTPDGKAVFVSDYKDVLLWNTAKGEVRHRLAGAGFPFAAAPNGKSVVSIVGALLRRWDVETGKPLYPDTADLGHTNAVQAAAFTPDGQAVVTTGADGTIRVWDLSTQRPRILLRDNLRYWGGIRQKHIDGHFGTYCPPILAVTPDDRQVLHHTDDGQLCLTDIRTTKKVRAFDVRGADNKARVGAARLSADGRTLWTLAYPRPELTSTIRLEKQGSLIAWDVTSRRRLSSRSLTWAGDLENFVIAPDGRTVAVADGSVRDVRSGKERLKQPKLPLSHPFAFSADGRLVAAMADREHWNAIAVYELYTGRPLMRVEAPVSWSSRFAFSPDGRLLIASGRDALHLWEVSSGRRLLHLPAEGRLPAWAPELFGTCLAVAPDGRAAATGHEDGTVLLWDLAPAWRRLAERPVADLTAEQLDTCWADLLKDDPRAAYPAMDRLTAAPAKALPLLRKHLRPVTIDSQWVADRLAALDSSDFAAREKASRDLASVAEIIEPRLRRELERTSSAEVRARLRRLLEDPHLPVLPLESVRQLRAVAVLEHIGTAEASELLRKLANGEPGDRLTRAAHAALTRLEAAHAAPTSH